MQRVLIIDNQLLVGGGIQSLLINEGDMEVTGFSPHLPEELDQTISRFQPDVVVLDEASRQAYLFKLLALLVEFPKLRIVLVSANDDLVRIYGKQEVQVAGISQLINIIRTS